MKKRKKKADKSKVKGESKEAPVVTMEMTSDLSLDDHNDLEKMLTEKRLELLEKQATEGKKGYHRSEI